MPAAHSPKPSTNGHALARAENGARYPTPQELNRLRTRIGKMDDLVFRETNALRVESLDLFRSRWMFDNKSPKEVMKQCRRMAETEPNDYLQFLLGTKLSFFNAGFELWTPKTREKTQAFLDAASNYPFADLARDAWREYLICDNAVAFWTDRARATPGQLIDGMPRVTIFNSEDVEYHNEFGIESVKITPKQRTLTAAQKQALGPIYSAAIENGKPIELSSERGECFKVLTTAKLGNGFAMPRWKAAFDDLAIRDLFRVGDFNGAWARKHVMRHGKKGHKITDGPLAGMPEYFPTPKYMNALVKTLKGQAGFLEMISNFDLLFEYVYLDPKFFDPTLYKGVEDRLAKWAGAAMLMLREGNPNPNLSKMFQAEGLTERGVVGKFLESIINAPTFLPTKNTRGMERLQVRWDEFIFSSADELRQMITFGLQNGVMSPQTVQRALRLRESEEAALMTEAHNNKLNFTPAFEAKQGNSNNGGDAGATGGRPAEK